MTSSIQLDRRAVLKGFAGDKLALPFHGLGKDQSQWRFPILVTKATLRPFEYNVLSRRRVRKRYDFDVLVARENWPELLEYVEFFQQTRGETDRHKGILKVLL